MPPPGFFVSFIIGMIGSKNKKHLRGSTLASIRPGATVLTTGLDQYKSLGEYFILSYLNEVFLSDRQSTFILRTFSGIM